MSFGGFGPGTTLQALTEAYNGTAWAEVNDMNTARNNLGGSGTQTAALVFGGQASGGPSKTTELWNGYAWS